MRYAALFFALFSIGCAAKNGPMLPKLMGPADSVDCVIMREGDLIGEYECTIKGRYKMESPGIF